MRNLQCDMFQCILSLLMKLKGTQIMKKNKNNLDKIGFLVFVALTKIFNRESLKNTNN